MKRWLCLVLLFGSGCAVQDPYLQGYHQGRMSYFQNSTLRNDPELYKEGFERGMDNARQNDEWIVDRYNK